MLLLIKSQHWNSGELESYGINTQDLWEISRLHLNFIEYVLLIAYFCNTTLVKCKSDTPPLLRCCHSGIEFFTDKTTPNPKAHGKVNGAD